MLAFCPPLLAQVTLPDVPGMLRADALKLALGVLLVGMGLAALALYARPLRQEAASLPWFGVFAVLYGLRLLARTSTLPLFFGYPPALGQYVSAAITYVIVVPGVLFVRAMWPRWRRRLGLVAVGLGIFAVCAIAADAVLRRPYSASTPNNLIAIALIVVALAMAFRPGLAPGRDLRTLRVGLAGMSLTALADNLRGLGVVSWSGSEVEPVGATLLIACVGTVAAHRALESAERLSALDRELGIARRIQSSILPRSMPAVAGLSVAARYQPMTAVAGDFYEFLEMGERRLGVLIADVSGHGVPAALIASMVKVAVAAQRPRGDRPASLLTAMNDTLRGQLGGQYVTAAYLYMDAGTGVMRYSAAGHPPLLRWRPGEGQVLELEENGLPLGLLETAGYYELEQPLLRGDRFLLYTDGLTDGTNAAGAFFGVEGVKAELAAAAALPAETVADRLLEKTRTWAGVAGDDLTFVLVDCVG